ncbi:MAG: ATP-dependent DNA helicase [Candidatus Nezhaarchaeota archaeon]|nr:ATP-dependent DNA helicase [Candidatus Nezhaarchaeota archaeon]MCX8141532.1 ATP-dependent DNA helicase [Candidatus Nezhaarchaeota archaeon]MDW8049799.1 ATP-dependent DNA helicase [Nitrososphaerota archaeon]
MADVKEEQSINFLDYFPYPSLRPHQDKAIIFAYKIFSGGLIGLLSSPCGTGKSISMLTGYLAAGGPSIGRLLILTRTKNQSDTYYKELKALRDRCGVRMIASIFVSRQDMCPLIRVKSVKVSYRDFLMFCRSLRRGLGEELCEYYANTLIKWGPTKQARRVVDKLAELGISTPEQVYKIAISEGLCPYEVTKFLSSRAHVIIGNYNYALMDPVRESILGKMGLDVEDVNCIFDEAHSLPLYAAEILSDDISLTTIQRAVREVDEFKVSDQGLLSSLEELMLQMEMSLVKANIINEEKLLDHNKLISSLIKDLRLDSTSRLKLLLEDLEEEGERIRLQRSESGKQPVSYIGRVSSFLKLWVETAEKRFVKYAIVESYGQQRRFKIGIKCLDPSVAAKIINDFKSCILMSGTLWEPDYYVNVLGLDAKRVKFLDLPSPFPKENMIVIVDMAVTTKFERRGEAEWNKIATRLVEIIKAIDGRVAVFFPSYEVMWSVMSRIKDTINLPTMMESDSTKISEVKDFVSSNEKCILIGVARGKISEGVEVVLEGRSLLNAVILVGLPYPKNTELHQALTEYFKEKFGDQAFKYATIMPCSISIAQSAGRLIRGPEDRGIVILMDSRASRSFRRYLPREWIERMKSHINLSYILREINQFIAGAKP